MLVRCILPDWAEEPGKPKVVEDDLSESEINALNACHYNIYYLPNGPSTYQPGAPVDGSMIDQFSFVFVDMDLKDGHYKTKGDFLQVLADKMPAPSAIVDSGNGVHAYWPVSDLTAMDFLRLQRRLLRHLTTDVAIAKIHQLMRYPGSNNTKNPDKIVACEILESRHVIYSCEDLNKVLPPISQADEAYCQAHYAKTYKLQTEITVDDKIPLKFAELLRTNTEVKRLWTQPSDDRSKDDWRLGHVMFGHRFSKADAMSVLVNSAKALERGPSHRVTYAQGIVDKIWTFEIEQNVGALSSSVAEILRKSGDELKGSRFPCHRYIDATNTGFRLGHVVGLVAGSGVGKCHGKDTPILMHDGTTKLVQDVVVGDSLMGPDSKPRRVLSLARGREMLYAVSPTKGKPYIVNESHILSLQCRRSGIYRGYKKGDILNISVLDYLSKSDKFKATFRGYKVGVEFPSQPTLLDPYFLGLWLGDGTSKKCQITTMDSSILAFVESIAIKNGLFVRKETNTSITNRSHSYTLSKGRSGLKTNNIWGALQAYNLVGNKHIPRAYLSNDRTTRLQLLAGIIDTDGSLSNNCYEITQKNSRLTDDIVWLARSLGLAAYAKPCRKQCVNNGVWGTYNRIIISGHIDVIPVILKHKKAHPRKQRKDVLINSISVTQQGAGDYYGFCIDSDNLYLLGDFTVTHNTAMALNMFMGFVQNNPDYNHFFIPLEQPPNEIADRWRTMCGEDTSLHEKVHVVSNYAPDGSFRHLSFDEIKAYLLDFQAKTKTKIGCVVIDHIGALKRKSAKGENQDIMDICHAMKAFAVELNVLLVMQSQAPREKAGIGDLELNKDAAYGTVYFESYSDYVITIWQPLKRCYSEKACPTVTAFKFCKIRHKKKNLDEIQEDTRYRLFFDPTTEHFREMNQSEETSFNFFNKKAVSMRKQDRKTGEIEYTKIGWT